MSNMIFKISEDGRCTIDNQVLPVIGFGTYPLQEKVCEEAVKTALKTGYRIIDTATMYNNFNAISHILPNVERSELFLISKVWHDSQTEINLKSDLDLTLKALGLKYLDAYLLHWPNSNNPLKPIIEKLQNFMNEGLVRYIGLSNVNVNHIKRAIDKGMKISFVQNEMNPFFYDKNLLDFCHKNNIVVQAWAPLGRGRINQASQLLALGNKYKKTPAQIALKWIVQQGCIPLPGSKNSEHIKNNFEIHDFKLTNEDMNLISDKAQVGQRERVTLEMGFGFADEFDYKYKECWPND